MSRRKWTRREDELVQSEPYCADSDLDLSHVLCRSREDVAARRRFLADLNSDSPGEPKQEGAR
jgi:hypothetical protein